MPASKLLISALFLAVVAAPACGKKDSSPGSEGGASSTFTIRDFQFNKAGSTFSWDISSQAQADFELLTCPAEGNCAAYVRLECIGQPACKVVDPSSGEPRANYELNISKDGDTVHYRFKDAYAPTADHYNVRVSRAVLDMIR